VTFGEEPVISIENCPRTIGLAMCSLLMWKSVGFDISMQLLFIFLPSSVLGQCCDLLMQTAISYTSAPSLFEDSRPSAPEPHDLFCSQFVFGEAAYYHKLWASIWKRLAHIGYPLTFLPSACFSPVSLAYLRSSFGYIIGIIRMPCKVI